MDNSPAVNQLDSESLSDLMVSYQNGDFAAFETFYYRTKPRLYQYLLGLTLNQSHAEDLLQETFLQVHRSRRTYQPGRSVIPWVFGIARHVYLMDRRAQASRRKHLDEQQENLAEFPIPPEAEKLANQDLIQNALRQLPHDRREALLLHQVWGFSFKEIGALLGIRRGTAKLRAHRGMKSLRRVLGEIRNRSQGKSK